MNSQNKKRKINQSQKLFTYNHGIALALIVSVGIFINGCYSPGEYILLSTLLIIADLALLLTKQVPMNRISFPPILPALALFLISPFVSLYAVNQEASTQGAYALLVTVIFVYVCLSLEPSGIEKSLQVLYN